MANKPSLLARLFGRGSQNAVVTTLYTHALGTPLLVHPVKGELLLGAYLDGAVDAPQSVVASSGSIAVINVTGGLVNRPMPGLCDEGPTSYVAIRQAFDEAMTDENVSAIVFRMDSPGGMASGCFDLADYIFAARGKKPIHAQVDDMAYSACYALAAACDEIQMTRTSGVGSVGVYTYHIDQSGYDGKVGIKVTYIFAGAKKVDGNPHEPISDSAKADAQRDINETYALFTTSVASYRGMNVEDVIASEAACYGPTDAIAAGFADSIGTLEDLLARLSTPAEPEPPQQESTMPDQPTPPLADGGAAAAKTEAPTQTAAQIAANAIAEIGGAVAQAAVLSDAERAVQMASFVNDVKATKLPAAIKMALIERGPNATPNAEVIANAGKVRDLCAAAHLESCATDYVKNGTDVEVVRKELSAAVADTGKNELITTAPKAGGQTNTSKALDSQSIYASRRPAQ